MSAVAELLVYPEERSRLRRRQQLGKACRLLFQAATWTGVVLLALLLAEVLRHGEGWLDWQFLTSFPSRFPERAGIRAALWGTVWLIGMTALFSVPVGIGAAVYLE
ncbi:MAG TPA: phosphate ABC transporter, permease protein PstA, partial [Terriglobia bacterium]|nr:phosphate ABC transporter, permease protein PstA [Terriglobia bacterium]